MRQTTTWTISLPPQMGREAEQLARKEHRTKSELVREALRDYMASQQWETLQRVASGRARRTGVKSEAEMERVIEEYRRRA